MVHHSCSSHDDQNPFHGNMVATSTNEEGDASSVTNDYDGFELTDFIYGSSCSFEMLFFYFSICCIIFLSPIRSRVMEHRNTSCVRVCEIGTII